MGEVSELLTEMLGEEASRTPFVQWRRVGARLMLLEMARRRVEQDTITYGDAVSACEKGGEWAKCQSS